MHLSALVIAAIIVVIVAVYFLRKKKKTAAQQFAILLQAPMLSDTCFGTCANNAEMVKMAQAANVSVTEFCSLQCGKASCMNCQSTMGEAARTHGVSVSDLCNMLDNCGKSDRRECLTHCLQLDEVQDEADKIERDSNGERDSTQVVGEICTKRCDGVIPTPAGQDPAFQRKCLVACFSDPNVVANAAKEGQEMSEFCVSKCKQIDNPV